MKSSKRYSVRKKGSKSRTWRQNKRRQAEEAQRLRKEARDRRDPNTHSRIDGETAQERYYAREVLFAQRFGRAGRWLHAAAWLTHNCVAHPLLGVVPGRASLLLHDVTADWLNQSPIATRSSLPSIPNRRAWILHNCVAHPLMGLAPMGFGFDLHEDTAEEMAVEGWV